MAESFEITWEKGQVEVPVLHLRGRLDAAGAKEMHEAVLHSLKIEGNTNLVIDLAGVEFVASTGLATFLLMTEEFFEVQGNLVFANATPTVMQVISLLNIDQFLKLEDSVEAATGLIGV